VSLFFILLGKIFPLYGNIVLGYLSTRYLKVDRGAIAGVLFYIISPVVVFSATMSVRIDSSVILLPVFFYLFSSVLAFICLKVFQKSWHDSTRNILAFTAGTGNTGYFGIGLSLILFEPEVANIFIFTVLSSFFYESTTGFYITAKGSFSAQESLGKVLRLPILYAFVVALVLNLSGVVLPEALSQYTGQFKVTFSLLGMMVIGMGLEGLRKGGGLDVKFLSVSLAVKHILWPLLIVGVILLDRNFTHLLYDELYKVMFVFAIVPLAGNTVTLAVLLKARPEKAAIAVLLSTLLSLVYIPLMMTFYTHFQVAN
jgi:predicted permease